MLPAHNPIFLQAALNGDRIHPVEPLDDDPGASVQHAAEMEEIVVAAGVTLEQVHHDYGIACWAVNQRGLDRGHGIRTGLEDVTLLPDGKQARDNADLVAAAARLIRTRADLRRGLPSRSAPSRGFTTRNAD